MELTVKELLTILDANMENGTALQGNETVQLCFDSRKCMPGDVFWALRGGNFDGHDYVLQAMEKGALMSVVNESWVNDCKEPVQVHVPVADTGAALLKLAREYATKFNSTRIAITGSNGKTTTKDMTYAILNEAYAQAGGGIATEGNYNNQVGLPLTIFRMKQEHKFAVLEMGTNQPGEIKILSKTGQPAIAVITNVGQSHLEKLKTVENVFIEKMSITAGLKKNGTLILNADDELLGKVRSTLHYKVFTFGIKHGQLRPASLEWDASGCAKFKIGRTLFHLKVPGVHNLYNALAAIAIAVQMKIPKTIISTALGQYQGTNLRMELRNAGGIQILADCYNANPSSMRSALLTLQNIKSNGRRILILGGMNELGDKVQHYHREIGSSISQMDVDLVCTIGAKAFDMGDAAVEGGMNTNNWMHFEDREQASAYLNEYLQPGDLCLVKGSRSYRLEKLVDDVLTEKMGNRE
jgi:UDP-N-acetylmuramoyl-tripeptide--D-alanyl-D-alanine ligase